MSDQTSDETSDQAGNTSPGRPGEQVLADWVSRVCAAMDVDPRVADVPAVLDLAKDAAHGIARPAAPLTTFLAGYLVGRAAGTGSGPGAAGAEAVHPAEATRETLAQVGALIPSPPDLDQQPPAAP